MIIMIKRPGIGTGYLDRRLPIVLFCQRLSELFYLEGSSGMCVSLEDQYP